MALLTGETLTRQQYFELSAESLAGLLHEEFDCEFPEDVLDDDALIA